MTGRKISIIRDHDRGSSTEAKCRVLSKAAKEFIHFRSFLLELGYNAGAQKSLTSLIFHSRSKKKYEKNEKQRSN